MPTDAAPSPSQHAPSPPFEHRASSRTCWPRVPCWPGLGGSSAWTRSVCPNRGIWLGYLHSELVLPFVPLEAHCINPRAASPLPKTGKSFRIPIEATSLMAIRDVRSAPHSNVGPLSECG